MKKLLLIVVFALTLAACSSNKTTLDVTATDQGYDSSIYTVPAGAEVTVQFTNSGASEYVFLILKQGEHATSSLKTIDNHKVIWYIVAPPGETKSGTFKAPDEPGEYDIFCPESGMKATLVVKEE